ncbi:O-antigen ligase family protein [Candidatus Uhrbacteria bacterium]|nr:O-antigen ligase family protein [Candidatus Uhrbacteria bacterium]
MFHQWFDKQWFDKPFRMILASHAAVFAVAIAVFHQQIPSLIILSLILAGVATLTVYKLEWGIAALFAELFANSHGHLIYGFVGGQQVGLRMAVFGGLMSGYLLSLILRRTRLPKIDQRLLSFVPLGLAAIYGLAIGWQTHGMAAIADGNGYFYLLAIFPITSVRWTNERRHIILQTLSAGAIWMVIVTLGLFFIFSHVPLFKLGSTYMFIRDTRTGELTQQVGNLFRVFLPGQFSIVVFLLIVIAMMPLRLWRTNRWLVLGTISTLTASLAISLSRSFWLGLIAGLGSLLPLAIIVFRPTLKEAIKSVLTAGVGMLAGFIVIILLVLAPLPGSGSRSLSELTGIFAERSTGFSGAAIDSRWKLLDPLWTLIKEKPITGHGFGQTVTFVTDDPRIRAEQPDGHYETYSLEWGWLELWLKMGIVAPLAFIYLISYQAWMLWKQRQNAGWLAIGLIASLVFLVVTHIFSPYLNHPLGLGLLLFVVAFLKEEKVEIDKSLEEQPLEKRRFSPLVHVPQPLTSKINHH